MRKAEVSQQQKDSISNDQDYHFAEIELPDKKQMEKAIRPNISINTNICIDETC